MNNWKYVVYNCLIFKLCLYNNLTVDFLFIEFLKTIFIEKGKNIWKEIQTKQVFVIFLVTKKTY